MVFAAGYKGFDSRLPRFWQASIGSICTQAREVLVVVPHDLCTSNHIPFYRPHMIRASESLSYAQASRDPCVRSILFYRPHMIRGSKPISFTQVSHDPCVASILLLQASDNLCIQAALFTKALHDPCVPRILLLQASHDPCIEAILLYTGFT